MQKEQQIHTISLVTAVRSDNLAAFRSALQSDQSTNAPLQIASTTTMSCQLLLSSRFEIENELNSANTLLDTRYYRRAQ
nr:hypothetical protein Iba_chr12dCG15610 [Ipomoea batatas]GMD73105.1 hypothetical protein Iba_chr12fCG15120 [Ipomoea batatas]